MKSKSQRSYFELHTQGDLLRRLGRSADEIADTAATQGESVIRIARLLIELFHYSAEQALGIATCTLYGPEYGHPGKPKPGRGEA